MELKPHDLVQIRGIDELIFIQPFPDWAVSSLTKSPFVVVRRAEPFDNCTPIGIRGYNRGQRFGAYLSAKHLLNVITPYSLSDTSNWKALYTGSFPLAIKSLLRIKPILDRSGYNWGPTGSAGFEVATGSKVLKDSSDLDLVLDMPNRIGLKWANELLQAIQDMATIVVDIQLNTPIGGMSMKEYINYNTVLIKTNKGPVLKKAQSIWSPEACF